MTHAPVDAPAVATPPRDRRLSLLTASLLYAALTLVATWPLAAVAGSATFRRGADTDLVVWILAWDAHAFVHQPLSIFDANIYYPEHHTLAFAENLIGTALLGAPVMWATGNAVLALNVTIILSCALCGLGGYVLGRRLGMSRAASFLAGAIFAFAPPRFGRLSQPHLNAVQWLPLLLASLHAYLDTGRRRDLWLAVGFFSWQVLSSGHGAVYAVIAVCALLIYRIALGEELAFVRRLRDFGVVGILLALPTVLVILPYRSVQREAGLERTLSRDWGPSWESFLESPAHLHQYLLSLVPGLEINQHASGALFFGILPVALTVVALWPRRRGAEGGVGPNGAGRTRARPSLAWRATAMAANLLIVGGIGVLVYRAVHGPFKIRWDGQVVFSAGDPWRPVVMVAALVGIRWWLVRRAPFDALRFVRPVFSRFRAWRVGAIVSSLPAWREAQRRSPRTFYAIIAAGSFLLAAPSPVGIWPWVYWLPGLNFVRVPARFTVLTVLGLSVLAGLGFDRLASHVRGRRRNVVAVLAIVLLFAEFMNAPLEPRGYTVERPPIDAWLNTLPKPFAIAEFPVLARRGTASFESYQGRYMLHSTAHWQKTIHGFSGNRTSLHEDLFDLLATFPSEGGVRRLKELEVRYLVFHTDAYPAGEWEKAEAKLAGLGDRVRLLHVEGAGRVYAVN